MGRTARCRGCELDCVVRDGDNAEKLDRVNVSKDFWLRDFQYPRRILGTNGTNCYCRTDILAGLLMDVATENLRTYLTKKFYRSFLNVTHVFNAPGGH